MVADVDVAPYFFGTDIIEKSAGGRIFNLCSMFTKSNFITWLFELYLIDFPSAPQDLPDKKLGAFLTSTGFSY